jgi:hypothetical protein
MVNLAMTTCARDTDGELRRRPEEEEGGGKKKVLVPSRPSSWSTRSR